MNSWDKSCISLCYCVIAITILSASSVVHAAAGSPVAHSHNGRSHTHPLPDTGKNHSHGSKPTVKANVGARSPVAHSHNGRSHTHPLPATGKNHTHGKKPIAKSKVPVNEYIIRGTPNPNSKINSPAIKNANWPATPLGWYRIAASEVAQNLTKLDGYILTEKHSSYILQVHKRNSKFDTDIQTASYLVMIPNHSCKRGHGQTQWYSLSGKLMASTDFVSKGSSLGDRVGDDLCDNITRYSK